MEETPRNAPYYFNISLKVILENKKGEILGLECKHEGLLDGYYDYPGGRINGGELTLPYAEIIAREMTEEVGADVTYKGDFCNPVSTGKYIYYSRKLERESCIFMLFFKAKYLGGDIKISEEHIGYKWIDLKKEPAGKYFTLGFLEGIRGYLENGK